MDKKNKSSAIKSAYLLGFLSILFVLSLYGSRLQAQGTITPELKKQLQLELKTYGRDLPRFKKFKDSLSIIGNQLSLLQTEAAKVNAEYQKLKNGISDKEVSIQNLKREIEELSKQGGGDGGNGNIIFRLQIAAFEKSSMLGQELEKYPQFVKAESDTDKFRKYTIGFFKNYYEVRNLEQYLLKGGAQVFVVGYENGTRMSKEKFKKLILDNKDF